MVVKWQNKIQDRVSTYTEVFEKFALHYTQNSFHNSRVTICEYIKVQFRSVASVSDTLPENSPERRLVL